MNVENLPALSIRQPWACRILYDGKDIENRTWHTSYRGRFYIHASKGFDKEDREHVLRAAMPLGGIVGIAEIVDCVTKSDSPWFSGPFGFVLRNIQALDKPIPCRGALGFFKPSIADIVLTRMEKTGLLF